MAKKRFSLKENRNAELCLKRRGFEGANAQKIYEAGMRLFGDIRDGRYVYWPGQSTAGGLPKRKDMRNYLGGLLGKNNERGIDCAIEIMVEEHLEELLEIGCSSLKKD